MTVERCHPAIRANCVAAVGVDLEGVESLAIVAEIDRHYSAESKTRDNGGARRSILDIESITATIRKAVSQNHDLSTHAVCLIKQRTIPKTSSGKIQRHICREQYLAGELHLLDSYRMGESNV